MTVGAGLVADKACIDLQAGCLFPCKIETMPRQNLTHWFVISGRNLLIGGVCSIHDHFES